jgi:Bacterial Ig-like domain (group 3)
VSEAVSSAVLANARASKQSKQQRDRELFKELDSEYKRKWINEVVVGFAQTAPAVTGTVNFYDGAMLLGPGTVGANGVATYQTSSLAVGAHTITAQYGGDTNYSASTSPAVQVTITSTAGSFALSANPTSITLTESQLMGQTTISVTPSGGFSSPVALTTSGVPAGFTASFAPATVTPNGSAATSVMTIQAMSGDAHKTTATVAPANGGGSTGQSGSESGSRPGGRYGLAFGCELAILGLLLTQRRKRIFARAFASTGGRLAFAALVGALAITFMAGCSAKNPSKTFTITVTGTSGSQTETTTITATLPIG